MRRLHQTVSRAWVVGVGLRGRGAKGTGPGDSCDPGPTPIIFVGTRSEEVSAWGGRRHCADAWGPGGSGSRWGRQARGRERRAGLACWAGRLVT